VETIEVVKKFLENLVPKVKFGVAHGRLKEKELIKTMADFQDRKIDVLIATTIIENGLDLPNVNTLIVADATHLGLSQAYQIRGRIGRSHIQAFAYFLYPSRLSEKAKIRLDALKEAEELGSGYKIALKDLEIRGAGNILGKEQSGNINSVGLNLYCQILSEAIEKLKP
jgi:transcription-repair coupling factor (superfamily II helicase)